MRGRLSLQALHRGMAERLNRLPASLSRCIGDNLENCATKPAVLTRFERGVIVPFNIVPSGEFQRNLSASHGPNACSCTPCQFTFENPSMVKVKQCIHIVASG